MTGQSSSDYERGCSFLFIFLVLYQESHPLLLESENPLWVWHVSGSKQFWLRGFLGVEGGDGRYLKLEICAKKNCKIMYEFKLSWFSWSSLGLLRLAKQVQAKMSKKIMAPLQITSSLFGLFETCHYLTAASASALQNRWMNNGRWLFVLKLLRMHHWRVTATQLEWLAYTQSYLDSLLCQTQAAIQGNYDSSPDSFQFFCLICHHPEASGAVNMTHPFTW